MKKSVSKLLLTVFLLVIVMILPITSNTTSTTNALELGINSVQYELGWAYEQYSIFLIHSNITIENSSSENITITFGDGTIWDTQLECKFTNKSLEYSAGEGITTLATVPWVFQPGITNMDDWVQLKIYDYNQTTLPDGEYTIIIGEYYGKYNEEIQRPGMALFEVEDGVIIDFTEIDYNSADFARVEVLIVTLMLLPLAYKIFRKKKKD